MTSQQKHKLKEYIKNGQTDYAIALLDTIDTRPVRTQSQHNALFLWFSMIEKEAENAGLTWDKMARHTRQLRITKENLHTACKQLTEALWGIKSTTQIKKTEQLDIIQQHFIDWFAKEGLTLPPFPSDEKKGNDLLKAEALKKHLYS